MKRDAEFFGEEEVELVQISRKLREAQRVEGALTEAGIDYAVEADTYQARSCSCSRPSASGRSSTSGRPMRRGRARC